LALSDLTKLFQRVYHLLDVQKKQGKAIEKIESEISTLKDRVTRLEAREEMTIVEAKAAAGVAASSVAMASVSDIAIRVGRLEERTAQRRLGAPE